MCEMETKSCHESLRICEPHLFSVDIGQPEIQVLNAHKHRLSKHDTTMYVWPPSHLHFRHSLGRKAPKREERGKKRCTTGT